MLRSSLPVCVLLVAASPLDADDWPQWRGPARTGHAAADAPLLTALPAEPKIIWRLKVGEGFASPVVAAGKLFYFDNQTGKETMHALQADNAKELWRAIVDDTFQDEQGPPGPRCTPVVDGDRVYAQSGKGELQCLTVEGLLGLSSDDGKPLWRVPLKANYGRNCTTPVIVDDWVVAGSYRAGLIGVKVSGDAARLK